MNENTKRFPFTGVITNYYSFTHAAQEKKLDQPDHATCSPTHGVNRVIQASDNAIIPNDFSLFAVIQVQQFIT